MSHKIWIRNSVLALLLLAVFGIPTYARAGGVCGGTYIVEAGETLAVIAAKCGTTTSAISAANVGLGAVLSTGQAITVPGNNYAASAGSYNGTHTIQVGDTFSIIANRYGVSMYDLWTANPEIADINTLTVGKTIRVPATSGQAVVSAVTYPIAIAPAQAAPALSYGVFSPGAAHGTITLVNKSRDDIYVSLHGTTREGASVIREYSISGTMEVKMPVGWYTYVAWVGGQKIEGSLNLPNEADRTVTFYNKKSTGN